MMNAGFTFDFGVKQSSHIREMGPNAAPDQAGKVRALQLLDLKDHDHVLELGSGPGDMLKQASEQFEYGRLVGLAFSDAMFTLSCPDMRSLIRSGRLEIRCGDARELPFEWESFNKVLTVVTRNFSDAAETLEEVYRVLKPGGLLVLGTCANSDAQATATCLKTGWRNEFFDEVEKLLINCGFASIKTDAKFENAGPTRWTVARKPKFRA